MRKILMLLGLGLALLPGMAHAQHAHRPASDPVTWSRCVVHLDWATMSHVNKRTCATYPIRKAHEKPIGVRKEITQKSPHVRIIVRYPTFPSANKSVNLGAWSGPSRIIYTRITGYSYTPECGDVNGITADGSTPIPYYTVASNDASLWHHFVYIPSANFHGYVQDTGAPLDLFMPSCSATYAVTQDSGEVIVYG